MAIRSLFEQKNRYGGVYLMLIVNRLQMLYVPLIMPAVLRKPYMVWVILAVGLASNLNLFWISRWLTSEYAAKGYRGLAELLGGRPVRWLIPLGMAVILIQFSTALLGITDIVHEFVFPSMSSYTILSVIFFTGVYLASHGMDNLIRMVIIVFLATVYVLPLFTSFVLPPIAKIEYMYPLIPTEWSRESWRALLFVFSSFSAPWLIVCLAPWLKPEGGALKYLAWGNAITVFESVFLFTSSMFFFGSDFLAKNKSPVVNMLRYLQSPFFERIDILLISSNLFNFTFAAALFLLCIYGGARVASGHRGKKTTPIGFACFCAASGAAVLAAKQYLWVPGFTLNMLLTLQMWTVSAVYAAVPVTLALAVKRKERPGG